MGLQGRQAQGYLRGTMSLIMNESNFQHILRVLNTNLDGKVKSMFALTSIKGVGRRFSNICCKKAEVELGKRAGELTQEEVERLVTIVQNPRQFKVPDWMPNRKKDTKDGKFSQVVSNTLDMKLREDLERLKKIRAHRGLRHYWGLRVRGQRYRFRYIRSYRYIFSDSIYSQNLQLNMLFDKINISNTNTFFFLNLVKHLNLSVLTNLYLCQMVYFRILRVLQELRLLHLESFYFNRNNISVFSRSKIPSIYFYILSVLFYLKRSNLKFYENFWLITPKNKIKRNKLRIYRDRRINFNLLNQVRLSYRKRGRGRL